MISFLVSYFHPHILRISVKLRREKVDFMALAANPIRSISDPYFLYHCIFSCVDISFLSLVNDDLRGCCKYSVFLLLADTGAQNRFILQLLPTIQLHFKLVINSFSSSYFISIITNLILICLIVKYFEVFGFIVNLNACCSETW